MVRVRLRVRANFMLSSGRAYSIYRYSVDGAILTRPCDNWIYSDSRHISYTSGCRKNSLRYLSGDQMNVTGQFYFITAGVDSHFCCYPHGNHAALASIPAGIPRLPQDSVIPIPVQVSSVCFILRPARGLHRPRQCLFSLWRTHHTLTGTSCNKRL